MKAKKGVVIGTAILQYYCLLLVCRVYSPCRKFAWEAREFESRGKRLPALAEASNAPSIAPRYCSNAQSINV